MGVARRVLRSPDATRLSRYLALDARTAGTNGDPLARRMTLITPIDGTVGFERSTANRTKKRKARRSGPFRIQM